LMRLLLGCGMKSISSYKRTPLLTAI